jgi:hypothetical protein
MHKTDFLWDQLEAGRENEDRFPYNTARLKAQASDISTSYGLLKIRNYSYKAAKIILKIVSIYLGSVCT